jgi:hypothetical protein
MELNGDEVHDLKNQLAIAIGMVELVVKYMGREPLDKIKINDKLEKSLLAMKKANNYLDGKKNLL